jgi:hypothetical protein
MTRQELTTLTWQLSGHVSYVDEHVQTLIEPTYGFINVIRTKIKKNGETGKVTGYYKYKGKTYKTWDEFAEAVKDVKYIPKKKTDDGWFD